eukprot:936907-Karenia_brevis.AAC.1
MISRNQSLQQTMTTKRIGPALSSASKDCNFEGVYGHIWDVGSKKSKYEADNHDCPLQLKRMQQYIEFITVAKAIQPSSHPPSIAGGDSVPTM